MKHMSEVITFSKLPGCMQESILCDYVYGMDNWDHELSPEEAMHDFGNANFSCISEDQMEKHYRQMDVALLQNMLSSHLRSTAADMITLRTVGELLDE